METHVRSIAKAVSWRIVATLTTMLLVFIFTGNLVVSGGVGLTELLSKMVTLLFSRTCLERHRLWQNSEGKMNDK